MMWIFIFIKNKIEHEIKNFFTHFLSIIITFNCFSCSGKNSGDYAGTSSITDTLKKKVVTLDSLFIMKYSADELIEINGDPVSDTYFPAYQTRRDKRNIFHFYSRDSKDIIRELNWNIDDTTYLLIWYALKDATWVPFTFNFYDTRAEY